VVIGVILGKFEREAPILVHNDGGDLIITYNKESVLMDGPVEKVFEGKVSHLKL
jgi:diaminopimelate epimerase